MKFFVVEPDDMERAGVWLSCLAPQLAREHSMDDALTLFPFSQQGVMRVDDKVFYGPLLNWFAVVSQ